LEGIDSIPVYGYEVIYHFDPVHIPYPLQMVSESGKKPEGRSFHHGRFIQNLRAAARRTPNVTVIESKVEDVVKSDYSGEIVGVTGITNGKGDCVGLHFLLDESLFLTDASFSAPSL
jgi:squalene monooxygenase